MDHLTALIRQGEGENVEFKEQWNDHGLEALSSFANTRSRDRSDEQRHHNLPGCLSWSEGNPL
jgi:predicted HTH transcriptional regulator